ncbi:hypothetical protein DVR12_13865 [Chitinophaga silvatica]|uniref:Uncharacterized protein n=1 Tax=Chitinophaga silvatica TaxID=2282649 RepID=A0A3E1Y8L3_9BACT|nr:hypothetical protein [Chitinophaga silvatica]RFS21743.1 hypothetical protein DVR12_13865 [Chitinophaga silvatica]
MKKNILFLSLIAFFSCTKTDTQQLTPVPDIESEILSKKTYAEFESIPIEKRIALVNFFDTASIERSQIIKTKIASLQSVLTPKAKPNKNKPLASVSEPTTAELLWLVPLNSNTPGFDYLEDDSDPGHTEVNSSIEFSYKWQMFDNIFGFYSIYSRERFKVKKDLNGNYLIESLQHMSSFIEGFTFGVTWTETEAYIYSGQYNAFLHVSGIQEYLGVSFEKNNSRYVNAGVIYSSYGGHY